MKRSFLFMLLVALSSLTFSQAPNKFKYQAVIRDASGNLKANQAVDLNISILTGSPTGTAAYSEEHNGIQTNAYGLVNINIGDGTNKLGDIATINWGNNSYYLSIEIRNGTTWVSMGSSQLLSVPYAVYSNKSGSSESVFGYQAGTGIDISKTSVITNTAPDKTVTFTNGTGASVTGTYPNFTVTNTQPNATHSGDATGSGSLKVTGLQGRAIADSAPKSGDALKWDGQKWVPSPSSYIAGSGISISGSNVIANTAQDKTVSITGSGITVGGSYPNFTLTNAAANVAHTGDAIATSTTDLKVVAIQNIPVSSASPTTGQIMKYNGSQWIPTDLSAGNGLTYSGNKFTVKDSTVIACNPLNAYISSGASTLSKSGGCIVTSSGTSGVLAVPIDYPVVLNGQSKKLYTVKVNYTTGSASITKTVVKYYLNGVATTLATDNTTHNLVTWDTYILNVNPASIVAGHLEIEFTFSGIIVLQNITLILKD